jgi:hypothetical protein
MAYDTATQTVDFIFTRSPSKEKIHIGFFDEVLLRIY